ncbi:MAG: hypothetical protein AAB372_01350 [Patescibacteria group bacterium]
MSLENPQEPSQEQIEATARFLKIDPTALPEEFRDAWKNLDDFNSATGYKDGDPYDGAPAGFDEVMLKMGLDVKKDRRQENK